MNCRFLTAVKMVSSRETRFVFKFDWPEFPKRRDTGAASALREKLLFGHNVTKISREVWLASQPRIAWCEAVMLPVLRCLEYTVFIIQFLAADIPVR